MQCMHALHTHGARKMEQYEKMQSTQPTLLMTLNLNTFLYNKTHTHTLTRMLLRHRHRQPGTFQRQCHHSVPRRCMSSSDGRPVSPSVCVCAMRTRLS